MSFLEDHIDLWAPEPNTGCFLWAGSGSTSNGYARKWVGGKTWIVSRLVCEETYGPPPSSKHQAAHMTAGGCMGPACVNGDHLRWATQSENLRDSPFEKRSIKARKAYAGFTKEQRSEIARKRNLARYAARRIQNG